MVNIRPMESSDEWLRKLKETQIKKSRKLAKNKNP
jgi:hypothetical protein